MEMGEVMKGRRENFSAEKKELEGKRRFLVVV